MGKILDSGARKYNAKKWFGFSSLKNFEWFDVLLCVQLKSNSTYFVFYCLSCFEQYFKLYKVVNQLSKIWSDPNFFFGFFYFSYLTVGWKQFCSGVICVRENNFPMLIVFGKAYKVCFYRDFQERDFLWNRES